jgi:hypothetical protein
MSMTRHYCFTGILRVWLTGLLVLLAGGCSRDSHVLTESKCDLEHMSVLQEIVDNSEIRNYAKDHFEAPETVFLWDQMPPNVEACGAENGSVKIIRSSSPEASRNGGFIAVYKMYFDNDAAFVEIGFPPSGKNADVFLRKKSGKWVVTQKRMWER